MATTEAQKLETGRLPEDPVAFVAAAERGINEYDLEATVAAYAPDATLESISDGARESFHGAEEIRRGWAGYLEGMRDTGFNLEKTFVSATDGVLVNSWESDFRGRTRGGGVEIWRFDADGRVAHHRMYTHFEIRPSTDFLQRLRLVMTHPRIAIAFLRATLRSTR
jgi:ketosteroid isomerase-like protein